MGGAQDTTRGLGRPPGGRASGLEPWGVLLMPGGFAFRRKCGFLTGQLLQAAV